MAAGRPRSDISTVARRTSRDVSERTAAITESGADAIRIECTSFTS